MSDKRPDINYALRLTCPLTTAFRSTRHTTFSFHTKPISAIMAPGRLNKFLSALPFRNTGQHASGSDEVPSE